MGQKDITEKLLEDYNDVFADIINGLIFKGEQRILPESLENAKVHSQYKAEDGKVHELERDVIKYWKEKKSRTGDLRDRKPEQCEKIYTVPHYRI